MKKVFIPLLLILCIASTFICNTSCSKDDEDSAYSSLTEDEKLLVDHYWDFTGTFRYYSQTFYFYKDHTFYNDIHGYGTWQLLSPELILTINYDDGNTYRYLLNKLDNEVMQVKYNDGYVAKYQCKEYGKAKESIGKVLYYSSYSDKYYFYADADSTYYSLCIYFNSGDKINNVQKGVWTIERDGSFKIKSKEEGYLMEVEDNITIPQYCGAPNYLERAVKGGVTADISKGDLIQKIEEYFNIINSLR